jgi:hypothetical protein
MTRLLDRATLISVALGLCVMLQPWWAGGFRAGFWITLAATLAQTVAAHLAAREDA